MDSSAFDEESASVIKLNNSTILLLKEVNIIIFYCIKRLGIIIPLQLGTLSIGMCVNQSSIVLSL